jgi:hypothetical protein
MGRGVDNTFGVLMTGCFTRCRRNGRGLETLSASRRYATSIRSCTCPMRRNIAGSPVNRQRVKKSYKRGLAWHPSSPFTPGDALKTSRADTPTPRQLTAPRRSLSCALFLTPPRVGATAAHGRAAPRGASTRGRSPRPPSQVSVTATAWPSRCCGSLRGGTRAGVSWHGANRNCNSYDTRPTAGVSRPRLCRASSHAGRPRPHAGGGSG